MTQAAKPSKNEQARLERLRRLMVLDSAPEPLFDEITKLASEICGTPIALLSLVDENRQWFKANTGLEGATETHRDLAFCAHAILDEQILEVGDATQDTRFKNNPLVTSDPNIRFYAGAPITLEDGVNIGTICVIDREAKHLNDYQRNALSGLAQIASKALLVRESTMNEIQSKASRLAAIVEDSGDAIISKSLDGIVTSWNKGAEKIFGYSAEEIVGKAITCLFPQNRLNEESAFLTKIKNNQNVKHFETVRLNKKGKPVQISVSLSPIKNGMGEIIGIAKIARDISAQKEAQKMIYEQHERLRVTMDSIGDAVITTDNNGVVQYMNPVAESLTGWRAREAKDRPLSEVFNIINETTRRPTVNPVKLCLTEDRIVGLANHTVLISRHGVEYGIEDSAAPIRDANGNTIGVVLVFHDVTAQREMANEISYRASHDPLTGLLNRSEFETRLQHYVNNNREPTQLNALMYIDLDQFKVVNDTCGHTAGDILLKEISKMMHACIRSTDTLARIGGDEFGLILSKCSIEKAMHIAKLICKTVDEYRFHHNNQRFRIGASIGLVMMDDKWSSLNEMLQAADNACYEAKRAGRGRVHLHFDSDRSLEVHKSEVQWAGRIEQAIEDNQFVLFCQRIMPLSHTGLEHAEILIRMKSKSGELIPPSAFLPAAERFHMASRIDRWVIKEVFQWMHKNSSLLDHVETISVNVSGQSLGDLSFHSYVLNLIESMTLDYSKLCIEITETAAITKISDAKEFIETMHIHGVKFSLDDFGSGVSSFGYLKNLPVDYLKIDGQFVTDLVSNQIGQATVRCITEVAKVTNKKTIAEWVDNQAVENMLKNMGVDFTQGYLKHKPAPIDCLLDEICSYHTSEELLVSSI